MEHKTPNIHICVVCAGLILGIHSPKRELYVHRGKAILSKYEQNAKKNIKKYPVRSYYFLNVISIKHYEKGMYCH